MNSKIAVAFFCGITWAFGPASHCEEVPSEDVDRSGGSVVGRGAVVEGTGKKLRTATVNIQKVFRSYHKVTRAETEINVERSRIRKEQNQQEVKLRAMDQALRELEGSLQELDDSDVRRAELEREKGVRFRERERWKWQRALDLKASHADLDRLMVARMEVLLEEIRRVVRVEAERMGYDLVFDIEGTGSSQVPFLLFAKDAHDITARIIGILAESAPQSVQR